MNFDKCVIFDNYLFRDTHGYMIKESLGYDERRSDYRELFVVEKNNQKYILKIGRLGWEAEENNRSFEEEMVINMEMSHRGIAPKIIETWKCKVQELDQESEP